MWQELIDVLEEIQQGYQSMLELSRKKRAVLVAVDMKGLEQVVDLEDARPPLVAHMMHAHIQETPSPVYHYEDPQAGHYIIERS